VSRGLGSLQRRVLEALAARPGGDVITDTGCNRLRLAPGIHDARQISHDLACQYAQCP
jgi:hypothetical protein